MSHFVSKATDADRQNDGILCLGIKYRSEVLDICPARDHFIFLTVLIISMTFVLSLTQRLIFLSFWFLEPWTIYSILSILVYILVCAAASLFCACLVSVQVSAQYVIAGSTQELYTCLFRQMARLLLKISRCLAYAAQPAVILCCISLSYGYFPWGCSVVPSIRSLQHFISAHCSRLFGCCLQPPHLSLRCKADVHLKTNSPTFIL